MIDRRSVFFTMAAVASAALVPLVPDEKAHVWLHRTPFIMILGYLVLAALSWFDHWSRHRAS